MEILCWLMLGLLWKCCMLCALGLLLKCCIDLYGFYCGNVVSTYTRFTVEMLYGLMLGFRWFW